MEHGRKERKNLRVILAKGIDLDQVKADENMSDVDDFDFICHVAYNQKPLTRKERAENVKNAMFSVNMAKQREKF